MEKAAQDDKMKDTNGSGTVPHVWDYDAVRIASKETALVGEVAERLGVPRKSVTKANRNDAKFREAYNKGKAERFVCVACGGPISTASIPGVSKCRRCFLSEEFPTGRPAPSTESAIETDLIAAEDPDSLESQGAAGAADQHSDAESEVIPSSIEAAPALEVETEPERTFFGRSIPADERFGGVIPKMDDHGTGDAVDRHLPGSLPRFIMELDETEILSPPMPVEDFVEMFMDEVETGNQNGNSELIEAAKIAPKLPGERVEIQGKVINLSNAGRLVVGFDGSFFDLRDDERKMLSAIAELLQGQEAR